MNWGKFLFSFEGRISRKAFWLFILALVVLTVIMQFVIPQPQLTPEQQADPAAAWAAMQAAIPVWYWPLQLFLLYIELAVFAKRWHDQDRSAWWNLTLIPGAFVCGIGVLVLLIMCGFIAGTPGPNKYGAEPMA